MHESRNLPELHRRRGLLRDRTGSSAMEFGLIFPFMLVMLFGCTEATQLVRVFMGLGVATEVMADLLSHGDPDTAAQVTDACNGAKLVMTPFNAGSLQASIAVVRNTAGALSVRWHDTSCGNGTDIANPTTLAASLVPNNGDEVIIVQTAYNYAAVTSYVMPVTHGFSYVAIARPRVPS